ncbi:unnamed protein product [Lactuca saligna]|uniref:Pectinesterase inhibitor domain-containing protein n=1 Tax=Lactuca saligna TaxID=75948 RepID=A0AA35Y7Y0_LACSI|nr:unnamed protein product [Lactuca saligna]
MNLMASTLKKSLATILFVLAFLCKTMVPINLAVVIDKCIKDCMAVKVNCGTECKAAGYQTGSRSATEANHGPVTGKTEIDRCLHYVVAAEEAFVAATDVNRSSCRGRRWGLASERTSFVVAAVTFVYVCVATPLWLVKGCSLDRKAQGEPPWWLPPLFLLHRQQPPWWKLKKSATIGWWLPSHATANHH